MTEKRYYKKEYEESYYIFDSKTLTEKEFEEKVEYEGYTLFADSLTPEEIIDLLNENENLKQFKENVIKWIDSQLKFNFQKYIETEDPHFKSENIDLHNFKVVIGIDSDD